MSATIEAEHAIRTVLHQYCDYFDTAHFEAFAALFERGRWFMVQEPGSGPVCDWINDNVVLYDGRPLTRHEITNLVVDTPATSGDVRFRCYVAIWQHLPAEAPRLLAHARFSGTFHRHEGGWHWREHTMSADYAGDLSTHIRGGIATVAAPG